MIINSEKLATSLLRKKALLIANAGYEAISIKKLVLQKIKFKNGRLTINLATACGSKKKQKDGRKEKGVHHLELELDNFKRVFILGIGKGSALASLSLAKILGGKLTKGIALDVEKSKIKNQKSKFKILIGSHPLPSQKNVKATQEIIKLAKNAGENDLIIAFICGGGSALLCGSSAELKASKEVFKKLTKAGADISELNTIRKHLSIIKGGGLAKSAYPATLISLIVSDVPANNLSMVASGPTVFDKTTKKEAERVLRKFQIPTPKFQILETPKEKKYFKNVKNILFVSNRDALSAMAGKAKKLKLKPKIYSDKLKGEAKTILLSLIKAIKSGEISLAAGESTVALKSSKSGKGGRNQEAVLGGIVYAPNPNYVFISFASDGRDNTEAAGAIGDYLTMEKSKKLKLNPKEFLKNHDSFNFFKKTGDLIFADKNSFNVSDLILVLNSPKE